MKVLIVEDDLFKLEAIRKVVQKIPSVAIEAAKSLREAMVSLEKQTYDFVILDMAIPSHTSDVGAIDTYSQPVGGLDVLLFLANERRNERVAILTQYPTVEYDRRHVPLRDLTRILHDDGVTNVVDVVGFSDKEEWIRPLLVALGVSP